MTQKEADQLSREEVHELLTPKQRIWCHEYIIDWNKSRAARVAGYKESSAARTGQENSQKPLVKRYVSLIEGDFEKEAGISKLRQMKRLIGIGYSSIAHLHNTWIDRKAFEDLTDEQKESIESIETEVTKGPPDLSGQTSTLEKIKIKLHPPMAAIIELNKMTGYCAPQKTEVTLTTTKVKWGDSEIDI